MLEGNQLGDQPGVTQSQAQITISVQDTNNNPPLFTPSQYTALLVEPGLGKCGGSVDVQTLDVADRDRVSFVTLPPSTQDTRCVTPQKMEHSLLFASADAAHCV